MNLNGVISKDNFRYDDLAITRCV